ncbi:unnamed protein product [Tilletia laevis]|uniref:Uncharacterized protein n=2 Tax=Tilletia TaxID=13289 RepID=A0A177UP47_9BASI|nr:hypothetical protein CF336_g8974 [Tilletia laevis]KAE8193142.1 hypothetical protein CF328_g5136 [Tilletia controversa]KAE8238841.1 hypothetical protein A4X03_0g8761 [Tilletia caries]KAE8182166.1 hypothetical protein CF335_g8719 [Tilletia laevis]CAD6888016.1 unnamed protein product [Tilletia caries]
MIGTLHHQRAPFGLFPEIVVGNEQQQLQLSNNQHHEHVSILLPNHISNSTSSSCSTPTHLPSSVSFPLTPREEAQNRLLSALSASTARRRKESDPEIQRPRLRLQQQNPRLFFMSTSVSMPIIVNDPESTHPEGGSKPGPPSDPAANARALPVPSFRIESEQDEEDGDAASSCLGDNGLSGFDVAPKSFATRRAAKFGHVRIPSLAQISKYVDAQRAAGAHSRPKPGSAAFLSPRARSVSTPASPTILHTSFCTNDGRIAPESSPSTQTDFAVDDVRTPRQVVVVSAPSSSSETDSSQASSSEESSTSGSTSSSSSSSDESESAQNSNGCGKVTHATTNPPTSRGPPRPTPTRRPFSISHQFGAIEINLTPPTPMLAPLTPLPHHRSGPPPSPTLLTTPAFQMAPGLKLQQEQAEAFWTMWTANLQAAAAGRAGLNRGVGPRLIQNMQVEAVLGRRGRARSRRAGEAV